MIDYECTWWPDIWFGISLTDCCIAHDLGGSDLALAMCIADKHPAFWIIGVIMFIGVILGRPIYRAYMRAKNEI
jgi:hypothetical protein